MITTCRGQHGLRKLRETYRATLLLGIILIRSSVVFAQVETAAVSGVITDQSGGTVVGAEVQVTNAVTNIASAGTSIHSGIYLVADLRPGRYRIGVKTNGFKGIDLTDLSLNVQDSVTCNFTPQIGSTSERVAADSNALPINTADGSVSEVVDHNFVENMPLNGRSFNTLLQLTPGVVIARAGGQTLGPGVTPGQFSIAGQMSDANNFTVEGVSTNFGVTTSAHLRPSGTGTDQAFRCAGRYKESGVRGGAWGIACSELDYSAEYGRGPGGQFPFAARSGTNQWHGTAFDYLRNECFDANHWFNNFQYRQEPWQQNDFGGTLGGTIMVPRVYNGRDKTFFLFSCEGLRLTSVGSTPPPLPSTRSPLLPYAFRRIESRPSLALGTACAQIFLSRRRGYRRSCHLAWRCRSKRLKRGH
jgi:hypothetical protein